MLFCFDHCSMLVTCTSVVVDSETTHLNLSNHRSKLLRLVSSFSPVDQDQHHAKTTDQEDSSKRLLIFFLQTSFYKMAEEEDPWAFDESTDTKTEETPAEGEAAPAGGDSAAPGAEGEAGTGEQGSEQPLPPAEDDQYRKPVQLYRHWVRPKFLQYKYMYNYRTNYYDDVIDYLDKKQRGVIREIPRAQTWAERVLRTNTGSYRYPYLDTPGILLSSRYWDPQYAYWWLSLDSGRSYEHGLSKHRDVHLIQTLAASIKTHNYHSTAYINRKYSSVL